MVDDGRLVDERPDDDQVVLEAVERWFVDRGTPHLIEQYSATQDVFTRALGPLSIIFLLEFTLALNADWRWWQNVLAAAGGFGLLVGLYALVNRVRGLPAWHLPTSVGVVELATFVLLPAVVTATFGQPRQAAGVMVANLLLLGAVYVTFSYGLVPLVRWSAAQVFRQLGEVGGLLSRALPLLLVFAVFLFLTPEVWEIAGGMQWPVLAANCLLFIGLGTIFLVARLPAEMARLGEFDEVGDVQELCAGTPAEPLAAVLEGPPETPSLSTRQRGNLFLVVLVSQGVQIVLVTLAVIGFFVLFGLLAVPPDIQARWIADADAVEPLLELDLLGSPAAVTPGLLRVATFLGVFSGFYVAIYAVTDQAYREQFFDRVAGELRQTFAVRAAYLAALRR